MISGREGGKWVRPFFRKLTVKFLGPMIGAYWGSIVARKLGLSGFDSSFAVGSLAFLVGGLVYAIGVLDRFEEDRFGQD